MVVGHENQRVLFIPFGEPVYNTLIGYREKGAFGHETDQPSDAVQEILFCMGEKG